ncbi:MAG: hypothetical protein DRO18_05510 [Thermoprotei archaeon]|nr:MAG: hypothetical protein DRO18_05510 [Thermoprotei archaeon]
MAKNPLEKLIQQLEKDHAAKRSMTLRDFILTGRKPAAGSKLARAMTELWKEVSDHGEAPIAP